MTLFKRILDLSSEVQKRSLFLFGPRQTGKTELLKKLFPASPSYNLLLADTFYQLSSRPHSMREELLAKKKSANTPVIIDEIQKLPLLLDEVQYLIQEHHFKFVLTGSSARKLKRGGANLLGGRAWVKNLFPLVSAEVPHYDLLRILNFGALPSVYLSEDPLQDLEAYVGTYLQQEIMAEGLVRKVEPFTKFLQVAALYSGDLINFANVANDSGVNQKTVSEYFEILNDTLVGFTHEPYTKTKKRKAIATAKFYFFDVGVSNLLSGRTQIQARTELFGKVLEHFIFTEIKAYLSYRNDKRPLTYWRSQSDYEVDFMIGDSIAIEVKGSEAVSEKHAKGLKALSEEIRLKKKIIVSMDKKPRMIGDVFVLPVHNFLEHLWGDEFV